MKHHYSPIYGGQLTNHLPMYQKAMKDLGVVDEVINERSMLYLSEKGIKDLCGKEVQLNNLEERYLQLFTTYESSLEERGEEEVVGDFLEDKMQMMSSGLFHGMIRLAFAIKGKDSEELACSLAYFDLIAQPMIFSSEAPLAVDLKESWNHLMASRLRIDLKFTHNATMKKAEHILNTPELASMFTRIEVGEDTERRMCQIFANCYLKTRDFYVLHVNTGFHSLVTLKPYIQDYENWLNTYWQMAQVFAMFTSESLPIIKSETTPWNVLNEEAKAMTDPHDVKFFYACQKMYDLYPLKVLNRIAHILSHKYWGGFH